MMLALNEESVVNKWLFQEMHLSNPNHDRLYCGGTLCSSMSALLRWAVGQSNVQNQGETAVKGSVAVSFIC